MQILTKIIKYQTIIILLIIIIIIIFFLIRKKLEKFTDNYSCIISKWDNKCGFYCLLGLKLNHYLHCKKHKINYKTINENWPYTFKDGWTDYFEDINLNFDKNKCKDINTKILNGLEYKFEKICIKRICKYHTRVL
jgi:hypothetical protein